MEWATQELDRVLIAKNCPGAGSKNRQYRTIEDTASRRDGYGSLRLFAEHSRSRDESAPMELKRNIHVSGEDLQRLIEASLQGVLKVPGLGAIATGITEGMHAESGKTIGLCQDGGERAR